jgi:hypothetical protein
MNTEFYLTKEFYNTVACATVLVIFLVLFFFGNIFKPKPFHMSKAERKMSEGYIVLNTLIRCCETGEQLRKFEQSSDNYFDEHFQKDSENIELKRYYSRLREAISQKENELYGQFQEA